ncbi:MAG: class II glutamine amidotransferase [Polyangiaceae bacterium]|nr:class II glutamine amidotransferase [Polyangiaceae bacterium]
MCRWVGYLGGAVRPEELLYETEHSLITQSQESKFYENGINGDGFGLGWYGNRTIPGIYRNEAPAWADRNLQEICAQVETRLFLAHIRASTGTDVQQTNCHPFRYRNWLFVHNGFVADYQAVRKELLMAISPELFPNIAGSTDSEVLFHLALTFGLLTEPIPALERMAGFVEEVGARHGSTEPLQMTLGLSDGECLYAVRYASGAVVNTLFMSESIEALRELYPERERLQHFRPGARSIVSEPLVKLHGAWSEVPVSTALTISGGGRVESRPFAPRAPTSAQQALGVRLTA